MSERIFDFGELRKFYFEFNGTKYFDIKDTEYLVNQSKVVLTCTAISLFIKKHPKMYEILDDIIEVVKKNIRELLKISFEKRNSIQDLDYFLKKINFNDPDRKSNRFAGIKQK